MTFGSKFNVAAFVFEDAEVSLLIATSPCAQFDESSTGNQNGRLKPEALKPDSGDEIYIELQRNPHIFCFEQHCGTNVSRPTGRRQGRWKIKDGGQEPEVDMK